MLTLSGWYSATVEAMRPTKEQGIKDMAMAADSGLTATFRPFVFNRQSDTDR
jgi:hypothetical protein